MARLIRQTASQIGSTARISNQGFRPWPFSALATGDETGAGDVGTRKMGGFAARVNSRPDTKHVLLRAFMQGPEGPCSLRGVEPWHSLRLDGAGAGGALGWQGLKPFAYFAAFAARLKAAPWLQNLLRLGSCFPRSQKRDLGHPRFMLG